MGTSDIALERVQALLKVETSGGSLHDHLVRVVRKLAEDKDAEALAQLETLSCSLKQSTFKGFAAPDDVQLIVPDPDAQQRILDYCKELTQLTMPKPVEVPKVLGSVRNFSEDNAMLQWAGVGFSQQEAFGISMSLRRLAEASSGLKELRFWGKILGVESDYYIAEGLLETAPGVDPPPLALPGTPEYDVEPRGEGVNTFTYWVASSPTAPWTRLPSARVSHILAAKSIKWMLTGKLDAPVLSMPWFPGKERHLLRAQIARISASCNLATAGWYIVDEETNKVREADIPTEGFPSMDDLETLGVWQHRLPPILMTGRCSWPDFEAFGEGLNEDLKAQLEADMEKQKEAAADSGDKGPEALQGIEADLEEYKTEEDTGSPAWRVRVVGDKGIYNFPGDAGAKSYRVVSLKSTIWPGAVTVAQGQKFANIYVGYALKSSGLLPPNPKTGLPLAGASPFMPLAPADIMDEPNDLEENEEPNPQEEEAESDGGDVDADE